MNKINPSIKHHLLIGALLGIWLFVFAFFVRPFEHGNMDLHIWINVSVGFAGIGFLSYGCISVIQNIIYRKVSGWGRSLEILNFLLFYFFYSVGTFLFYRSSLVNGVYEFPEFFYKIILNIALILTPILFLARRYSLKLIPKREERLEEDIIIKGENKRDILRIKKSELICVSNSQNYVEIFFMDNGELKKKIIRNSLKRMKEDFNFLIQVHRSHLINPDHFKSWKNPNTISLTQIELPISKNYKDRLMAL